MERQISIDAFVEAAQWYRDLVAGIDLELMDSSGLGEWNLRELIAHTSRATSVVEEYFRHSPVDETPPKDDDPFGMAGAYYASAMRKSALHAEVAERGRLEASLLGTDPRPEIEARVQRAIATVRSAPEGALFVTRFGTVGFAGYLCTRTVELVVHGIDVCDALGIEANVPALAARVVLAVLAEIVSHQGQTAPVIRALAGRSPLIPAFGVFS